MPYSEDFTAYCNLLALRLTSLRKAVLFILWRTKKPLKAYEILDDLVRIKSNATPPSVYRTLMFFVNHGIVHKIESIQSYTLCCEPEKNLPSEILMVCNQCHQVIELYDKKLHTLVNTLAKSALFKLDQDVIELHGVCDSCQSTNQVLCKIHVV